MNGDNQRELPLSTFWYTVTFFAGLYWGISFYSGAWGSSLITPLLAPPAICLSVAIFEAAGDRIRIILGALTLYGNFLFTFAIGYTLAGAGVIQFSYNSNSTTQAEPSLSEARRDLLSLASQIELKQSQQDVRVAFKRQGSNNLTLAACRTNNRGAIRKKMLSSPFYAHFSHKKPHQAHSTQKSPQLAALYS